MRNTGQRLLPPSPQSPFLGCTSRVPSPDLSREHDLDNRHPRLVYLKEKRQGLARWTKKNRFGLPKRSSPWSMSITRRGTLQLTELIIWASNFAVGENVLGELTGYRSTYRLNHRSVSSNPYHPCARTDCSPGYSPTHPSAVLLTQIVCLAPRDNCRYFLRLTSSVR